MKILYHENMEPDGNPYMNSYTPVVLSSDASGCVMYLKPQKL